MNLPNKITISRIIMALIMLIILMIPWDSLGIIIPTFSLAGRFDDLNLIYIISGVLFIVAALTDFIDGKIARSRNLVTDYGKVMDAIADKVLVNGLLIILACQGRINEAIPVIIITRDIFVDAFKMASGKKGKVVAASFAGKAKTMCMMIGLALTMFSGLPFSLIGINLSGALLIIACILSVVSGCQYYYNTKDSFKEK